MISKSRIATVVVGLLILAAPAIGKKGGKPGGETSTASCTMDEAASRPAAQGYVASGDQTVEVGMDTKTYGPVNQVLYLHSNLVPSYDPDGPAPEMVLQLRNVCQDETCGPYYGTARVTSSRVDYFFDTIQNGCVEPHDAPNFCPFRLIVVDGKNVKRAKPKRVEFRDARTLVIYRPCDPALNPACLIQLYGCYDDRDCPDLNPDEDFVYAWFDVQFQ